MQGRTVLLAAADMLEREGWVQGTMCATDLDNGESGRCAVGALYAAFEANGNPSDGVQYMDRCDTYYRTRLQRRVEAAMRTLYGNDLKLDPYGLTVWNDASKREKSEVVALLRKAATL